MNYLIRMQVFQRTYYLRDIALNLELSESFPSLDQFVESLVRTQFQHYIDVLRILKNMFELDYM